MRELWKIVLETGGARIYGVIVGVLTLSLTARWLGPGGRGELVAITTWVTTFSTLAYLSLGQVAIHRASHSQGGEWLQGALSTLATYALVLTSLGWLTAAGLYHVTGGSAFGEIAPAWLMLGFLMLPLKIWEEYGRSLLMALERLSIYNRFQMFGQTLSLVTVVALVVAFGLGVAGALLGTFVGQFVVAAGGIGFLLRQAGGLRMPQRGELTEFLQGGLKLHLNAVGTFLFTAADILMLNYYRGVEETGYYQLGVRIMTIMLILPQAASMVMYGRVSNKGANGAWQEHKRILWQLSGIMILGAVLAGLTAPWWIVWIAGEAFSPTVGVFRWQLLAVVGMTFSTVMAPQWIGRGYFWQASLLTLFVGLANLGANAILIPEYGMYGAVWASLGVYAFAVAGNGMMLAWCNMQAGANVLGEENSEVTHDA